MSMGVFKRKEPVLQIAVRTDVGLKRLVNEDSLLAADPCFLVADGMGGHDSGDRASRAAIAEFSEAFTKPGSATLEQIDDSLGGARAAVHAISAESPRGAGCTLTGVIRTTHEGEPYWYVLNVGDSRVYLLRDDELSQLTHDHSLHAELQAATAPEADLVPRNVITRALGSEDDRHDAWLLPMETGTRLLICSDGLTNEVSDELLSQVLTTCADVNVAAEELLQLARDAGGRDNITLVVVDVVSGGARHIPREEDPIYDTLERTKPGRR